MLQGTVYSEKMVIDKDTKIFCHETDHEGVRIVAEWVREDLKSVFGHGNAGGGNARKETLENGAHASEGNINSEIRPEIIAGTYGKSGLLQELYQEGLITAEGLLDDTGAPLWEVYKINPVKWGGKDVIVIQGSDKRGTMYGLLAVSEACGVSPFIHWSDAKPVHREQVELSWKFFGLSKEPSVKYRGIFINDEWPAFGNWAAKRFGGINAKCYGELFELLIRLHGNYMWPAMWAGNFSMDGPGLASAELADRLGIVMSTSHHEPCMRTGEEYRLLRGPESVYGDAWDFLSNREGIIRFWEDGLKRNAPFENVITMGMRGERDTAIMAKASLAENIALLRDIIKTQNDLIRKYVNPDLRKVPRQFVLFTEVEKFYYGDENTPGLIDDPEMDGITVIFSDTNYGYTRTLPAKDWRERNGGYGMYYHVDMHGGAYSYEWIGSTYLPRIRDQLETTYDFGVDRIWVVNVGDLVSQELEVSYIMKLAYDVEAYAKQGANGPAEFVRHWVDSIFGGYFEKADVDGICEIIRRYSLINERRKHEIMNDRVYHPAHFDEARDLYDSCVRTMELCDSLLAKAPKEIYTAFYELIYYPAYGTANLHKTWIAATWNKFYAHQNRNTANDWCEVIDEGIRADQKLIEDFHALSDGKFYGQALSEHFGFRNWNDSANQLPMRTYVYPARKDRMLVCKTDEAWFYDGREYMKREETIADFLRPDVDEITLEISCGSIHTLHYSIDTEEPWIGLEKKEKAGKTSDDVKGALSGHLTGSTDTTDLIRVRIDRTKLPGDKISTGILVVKDGGECFVTFTVKACTKGYYEDICRQERGADVPKGTVLICNGYGVTESNGFTELASAEKTELKVLTPYGRHGYGLKLYPNTADLAGTAPEQVPSATYTFLTDHDGEYEAELVFAPSLPVRDEGQQYFDLQVNDGERVRINAVLDPTRPAFMSPQWGADNRQNAKSISHDICLKRGLNRISYSQISPNLILERVILWDKAVPKKESYLGPKDSFRFS